MKNYLTPEEVSLEMINMGIKKSNHSASKLIILGLLAGAYIGFAGHLYTTILTGWHIGEEDVFYGLKKMAGGSVFAVGLMIILIPGAELFTGNCLMAGALFKKKITLKAMMRNWAFIWAFNFAAALALAFVIANLSGLLDGEVGKTAVKIAAGKAGLTALQMFVRGVLANWIVCVAVLMYMAAKDIAGKILGILFPIMGFVAAGFEHSIANMYLIPAGLMVKASHMDDGAYPALTIANGIKSILIVTGGNIVGGVFLVAAAYYLLYVRKNEKATIGF